MHKSFKEMPIWQEALDIAEKIFAFTYAFASYVEEGLRKTIEWYRNMQHDES